MMTTVGLVPKLEPDDQSEATPMDHGAEPVNFVDLEERILRLCSECPKGITDEMISRDQPSLDIERRVKALQRLLSQVRRGGSGDVRQGGSGDVREGVGTRERGGRGYEGGQWGCEGGEEVGM